MTKRDALRVALSLLTADSYRNPNWTETNPNSVRRDIPTPEIREILVKMIGQLSGSDEARTRANQKRKEATAAARATLIAKVAPVLRKYLTDDITAQNLYERAKNELPEDFSAAKVQNILLRELAPELIKTEAKNKANTYRLK